MEHREDGLLVDFSGQSYKTSDERPPGNARAVVFDEKQEKEMSTLSQETRLMRAMNEIRAYTPKNMTPDQRERFRVLCDSIFQQHGITPETYKQAFGFLGTPQDLRR